MTQDPSAQRRFDLPTIEDETRAFWDAAAQGRLMIGWCRPCKEAFYYPRPFCPKCWSEEVDLREASGRGTLYTYSVVHFHDLPPFKDRVPYVVAMVDLDEGVRLSTNIVECEPADLRIGMPVSVVFQPVTDDIRIPVFRPLA